MRRYHVTSLDTNIQRLPTPVPIEAKSAAAETSPIRRTSSLLTLPDELKLHILSFLVEPRAVMRAVTVRQGAYRNRTMILRADHVRAKEAWSLGRYLWTMIRAIYNAKTHFHFDFAPSFQGMRMPWQRASVHAVLQCDRAHLSAFEIVNMQHISLSFRIYATSHTEGSMIASNHTSMINVARAVFIVTAYGLDHGRIKSLHVDIKVHGGQTIRDHSIKSLMDTFLIHNSARKHFRRHPSQIQIQYID